MRYYEKYICLIVDAFSTGKTLPNFFKGQGYACIHVQSSKDLPFQCEQNNFTGNFVYNGNIEALLKEVSQQFQGAQVKLCLPGSESGVVLADLLSEHLGLATNGSALSQARRNKYDMVEQVRKRSLKTVLHTKSKTADDIIAWTKRETQYPIVLKPLGSANGDGVHFCHQDEDVRGAVKAILSNKNIFGEPNEEVLAESMNYGHEYIVNTASCESPDTSEIRHFVTEIWRVDRKPFTTIYDKAEIIYSDSPEYPKLAQYTFQVLNALGIKVGAATTELKYTPDGGPVLIETAARIMGGAPLSLSNDIFGYTQLSLSSLAYLNPRQFFQMTAAPQGRKEQFGMDVFLISNIAGVLSQNVDTVPIEKLEALHGYVLAVAAGMQLPITTNSLTAPGEIYLLANNREKLMADYKKIREFEGKLFENAIKGSTSPALFPRSSSANFLLLRPGSAELPAEELSKFDGPH